MDFLEEGNFSRRGLISIWCGKLQLYGFTPIKPFKLLETLNRRWKIDFMKFQLKTLVQKLPETMKISPPHPKNPPHIPKYKIFWCNSKYCSVLTLNSHNLCINTSTVESVNFYGDIECRRPIPFELARTIASYRCQKLLESFSSNPRYSRSCRSLLQWTRAL